MLEDVTEKQMEKLSPNRAIENAFKKVPVVYIQNSGEENIINPVMNLMKDKVYAIPCVFIVG